MKRIIWRKEAGDTRINGKLKSNGEKNFTITYKDNICELTTTLNKTGNLDTVVGRWDYHNVGESAITVLAKTKAEEYLDKYLVCDPNTAKDDTSNKDVLVQWERRSRNVYAGNLYGSTRFLLKRESQRDYWVLNADIDKDTGKPYKTWDVGSYSVIDDAWIAAEVLAKKVKKPMCNQDRLEEEQKEETEQAITSLMTKEHEPLIIRKYTQKGFPLYVSLICGANLDNLDTIVLDFVDKNESLLQSGSIQDKRNLCGMLTEHLCKTYGRKAEGVAVLWYMDKMWVSSLYGDMMNHESCKLELFTLLSIMPHI